MNNNIETNIVYTGEVSITVKSGSNVITFSTHNAGLQELFRIMSKAITGNQLAAAEIPTYIDLRYLSENNPNSWQSCLINIQPLTQRNYAQENGLWISKFASTIPYSEFIIVPPVNIEATDYRLYLMSSAEDLAYINVDKNTINAITAGTQAIVEWVMRLSNG